MLKFKEIMNVEQGILNIEFLNEQRSANQARQHFDIQNSLFNIRYFFLFK